MYQTDSDSLNGILTYSCEGNNNSASKNFSRRLRFKKETKLVIGRGYDLTSQTSLQIMEDLTAIGLLPKKADLLSKVPQIPKSDLKAFYQKFKHDILLSQEQEKQLFAKMYERLNEELLEFLMKSHIKYGIIDRSQIPNYQWEILLDFQLTGELHTHAQNLIFTTLKKSITARDPKPFDILITDFEYWRSLGVDSDRAKQRSIFVREWKNLLSSF